MREMQSLIEHARTFRQRSTNQGEELESLANGQSPQALFITCSDSRVVPSLITAARPGELFELRIAGNIVPAHCPGRPSGEAATLEYAVEVLGVADVVVCGHSHCGAIGALVRGDDLTAAPAVQQWLTHAAPQHLASGTAAPEAGAEVIAEAARQHVLAQLMNLRTYPCVQRRLKQGRLRLHGWFYEIETGAVLAHRPETGHFLPL
jgi:carbonic anhydrase